MRIQHFWKALLNKSDPTQALTLLEKGTFSGKPGVSSKSFHSSSQKTHMGQETALFSCCLSNKLKATVWEKNLSLS